MLGAGVAWVWGNDVAGRTPMGRATLDDRFLSPIGLHHKSGWLQRIVWRMHTGNGGLRVYGSMTALSGSPLRHGLWSLGATTLGTREESALRQRNSQP